MYICLSKIIFFWPVNLRPSISNVRLELFILTCSKSTHDPLYFDLATLKYIYIFFRIGEYIFFSNYYGTNLFNLWLTLSLDPLPHLHLIFWEVCESKLRWKNRYIDRGRPCPSRSVSPPKSILKISQLDPTGPSSTWAPPHHSFERTSVAVTAAPPSTARPLDSKQIFLFPIPPSTPNKTAKLMTCQSQALLRL